MGKTPKDKDGVERRRPYNYPRNAQAQTQNYGTESRNYSYSTGNVPRKIPIYHSVPFSGVCGPLPNQAYRFGAGRGYRDRLRGINKPLKPILNRQRRPDLRSKRVLSPRHKVLPKKNMQADTKDHDTVQDEIEETQEQVLKNGPETPSENDKTEGKEKAEDKNGDISNNIETCDSNGITDDIGDDTEKVEPKSKPSSSKEKKAKKGSAAVKMSPKGKHSPKSKKEPKPDSEGGKELETKEIIEEEKSHLKKLESELGSQEASGSELQPSVKIMRLDVMQSEMSDTNDSVIEIPIENETKSKENVPCTSKDESTPKVVAEVHTIRDSPRRSTRLSIRQTPPPKPKMNEKVDSSSIIVLDSDDSIPILEISRTFQERSFAQSLRSLSGRPSLRPLPAYNRSYTAGSASIRSNFSSRSITTTSNDSESDAQETKLAQSKPGLWGIFRSPSTNTASQDSATDNEESTNRSYVDESGNDSEATTEPPFETASNVSFRKRKVEDAEIIEPEQEIKKIRGDSEKIYDSSGLLSIVSSPMNLFASKLRGDKVKSSTPVQLLKTSDMDDEDAGEDNSLNEDVSEIQYEENISKKLKEEDMASLSQKIEIEQEAAPRRWCSIM